MARKDYGENVARISRKLGAELRELLDGTDISLVWAMETAVRDFLNGRRAEQINELKGPHQ